MSTTALDRPVFKTVTLDILLCAAAIAVPSLSHAAALPLYKFDPMRLLIFVAILFTSRRNALLMALWLPLLSLLTSGHPVFPKVMLIQGELALNVLVFSVLFRRMRRFVLAAGISVLVSKAAYYAAKFVLIRAVLLEGDLIATPWHFQLTTFVFILLAGGLICQLRGKDEADSRESGRVHHV